MFHLLKGDYIFVVTCVVGCIAEGMEDLAPPHIPGAPGIQFMVQGLGPRD